ncbi:DUF4838 domain-containing protein [Paenibacillus sp. 1P07SE]|uniref:DUF4838 domain-containing protein n=1 Tax=Paenibacillus sp. 1P07SE TaxID=3132209 RepID=UPI0039A4B4EC
MKTDMGWTGIRIMADTGSFGSIREAAGAERRIDWWDEAASAEAAACTTCYGAVELAEHLCLVYGETPIWMGSRDEGVVEDVPLKESGHLTIWVGIPAAGTTGEVAWHAWLAGRTDEWELLPDEGYVVVSRLMEDGTHWIITGRERRGTLYGVYALLEKLGFRWYGLGKRGAHIPQDANLTDEPFELMDYPRFLTRGVYSEHIGDDNPELIDWLGRNRINFASLDRVADPHALQKRGIRLCMGGHHILYRFLNPHAVYPYRPAGSPAGDDPEDPYEPGDEERPAPSREDGRLTYAEAHPEWFGLVDGKRSFDVGEGNREGFGDNFCTTHPDAVRELCLRVTEDLIDGQWRYADDLNFWMLDNGTWCQCPRCEQSGNYAYKMILLVHALSSYLELARTEGRLKRRIRILFPIYHETLPAPDRPLPADFDYSRCFPTYFPIERCYVHTLADPGCTESNQELMATFVPWTTDPDRHYLGDLFVGEYYNVSSFAACPVPLMTMMAADIPFYYRSGVRHLHYMHLTDRSWGPLTLTNYQLYRMLWHPELDSEELLADYYRAYYGESASKARQFYEKLEEAMRNSKYLKHYQYSRGIRHSLTGYLREDADELFPLLHMKYDTQDNSPNSGISLTETVAQLYACRALLDAAIDVARDEVMMERLLEDERRFRYLEDMILTIYGLVRTHRFTRTGRLALARRSFLRLRSHAEALERETELIIPTTRFPLYDNGLKATWCEQAYERYLTMYGGDE